MIWPLLTLGKLHHIFLMVLEGELYTAPIPENISQVLDLGTGTGAWAMDLAEYVYLISNERSGETNTKDSRFPQAIVTG